MDDRSTKARIRDSALQQFTELGFKGATVRGIAKEAGVSPGAVQRHFPTKEDLREACDAYVEAAIRQIAEQKQRGDLPDSVGFASMVQTMQPLIGYVHMALTSGSTEAERWFDTLIDLYQEMLTSEEVGVDLPAGADIRAIAVAFGAAQLGVIVFFEQVLRALGAERSDDPAAIIRLSRAQLFMATERYINEQYEAIGRAALDSYAHVYGTATPASPEPAKEDVND